MNQKTAKKLRQQAAKLALHTILAADEKKLKPKYGTGTFRKIYRDIKKGRLCPD